MKKKRRKSLSILKYVGLLFSYVILGAILLMGVYMFPTGRIKENVAKSSHIFDWEQAFPQMIDGFLFTQLDNFTDSIILGIAMYDGEEGFVEKAMANYRMYSDDLGVIKSTTHYANDVEGNYYSKNYFRYWHGNQIIVKPLLAFFDYGEIRLLNGLIQLFLIFYMIKLLSKSKIKKHTFEFLGGGIIPKSSSKLFIPSVFFSFLPFYIRGNCLAVLDEKRKVKR